MRTMPYLKVEEQRNDFLACMSPGLLDQLTSHLELYPLVQGRFLCRPHQPLSHFYFPVNGIVSNVYTEKDGATTETSLVGREGFIGAEILLGVSTTPSSAVVVSSGKGYRLAARILTDEFSRHGELMDMALRHIQILITQTAQIAVCNRHHSLKQRLCRWFLLMLDRLPDENIFITQEMIAAMLGVRREGVTEEAVKLLNSGAIYYCRGHIRVVDRSRLERYSCECYRVIKAETDRLHTVRQPQHGHSHSRRESCCVQQKTLQGA
jgi:CRP-like cAMP-binding protein